MIFVRGGGRGPHTRRFVTDPRVQAGGVRGEHPRPRQPDRPTRGLFFISPGGLTSSHSRESVLAMSRAALSPAKRNVRSHTSSRRTASSAFWGSPGSPELEPQRPTTKTYFGHRHHRRRRLGPAERDAIGPFRPEPGSISRTPMMRNQLSVPSDSL